jgi:hypothetical protein
MGISLIVYVNKNIGDLGLPLGRAYSTFASERAFYGYLLKGVARVGLAAASAIIPMVAAIEPQRRP